MLQTSAIDKATLGLVKNLLGNETFSDFFLVGGTALALQLGHRFSYDIDLFNQNEFDVTELEEYLMKSYKFHLLKKSKNTLIGEIDGIKVDFITYKYPLIDKIIQEGNIRMFSIKDIAPMKLSAIAGRGIKRDFFDIYFILKEYSLDEMLDFFKKKYSQTEIFHVLKSLIYFDDAENNPSPVMIKKTEWSVVKKTLQKIVNDFLTLNYKKVP